MIFKPGDKVKLKPTSEYYRQAVGIVGQIRDKQSPYANEGYWLGVDFTNGYKNSYHEWDLELVEPFKKVIKPYPVVAFLERR